jgi:hypothetical protein
LSDPRQSLDWKRIRHEQKVELLLGAILDALLKQKKPKEKA